MSSCHLISNYLLRILCIFNFDLEFLFLSLGSDSIAAVGYWDICRLCKWLWHNRHQSCADVRLPCVRPRLHLTPDPEWAMATATVLDPNLLKSTSSPLPLDYVSLPATYRLKPQRFVGLLACQSMLRLSRTNEEEAYIPHSEPHASFIRLYYYPNRA